MYARRRIEIFSTGCTMCEETITLVNRVACPACEVTVLATGGYESPQQFPVTYHT